MRGQNNFKTATTEMWFLRRMLRISLTAGKSNKTVLRDADTHGITHKENKYYRLYNRFQPCDEKKGTGASCDNQCDRSKTQQVKTVDELMKNLDIGRVANEIKATRIDMCESSRSSTLKSITPN